jgi:hypothetical protein
VAKTRGQPWRFSSNIVLPLNVLGAGILSLISNGFLLLLKNGYLLFAKINVLCI